MVHPRSLPINPVKCTILNNQVFDNFKLADKPFAKTSRFFNFCVLGNDDLCGFNSFDTTGLN